ncbi:MAG: hypothetical protein LBM96_09045 [Methanobrevibacter sp.]|jgi:hypothetical protein|nr:hypothetical protein [Candidatus Methanoflexus mossambicus]
MVNKKIIIPIIVIIIIIAIAGISIHNQNEETKKSLKSPYNVTAQVISITKLNMEVNNTAVYEIETNEYKEFYTSSDYVNPNDITVGNSYIFTIQKKSQIENYEQTAKVIDIYPV